MLIFVLVFLFFQLILNLPSYADMDKNSDLKTLTAGVNQISSPGIPGNISVFGPNTFGVIQDKKGQVVVAGAKYHTGRVLLWGHDGFFNKDPDTGVPRTWEACHDRGANGHGCYRRSHYAGGCKAPS